MAGYVHITRAGAATGTYGATAVPEYQLTYVSGSESFARTFMEADLEEFLVAHLALDADVTASVMDRTRLHGNATVSEVDLPSQTAAALGFVQLPSER